MAAKPCCYNALPFSSPEDFPMKLLTTPAELADLMAQGAPLAIIDVRDHDEYLKGHLPGARHLREIFTYLAASTPEGLAALQHDFAELLGKIGVSGEETVVIYEDAMDNSAGYPRFRPVQEIRDICLAAGIKPTDTIYLYCFKGARASNTLAVLLQAGFEHARLYFGSWNEWSRDSKLPIDAARLDG
jgi:thiosulfate/3-mercaptopyruvate sulfurtransferase